MLESYKNISIFLFMNFIVIFSSYQFLKLFSLKSLADNIQAFALLFCSQIILTEIFLGIFKNNKLTLPNLIIVNLLILIVSLLFVKKRSSLRESRFFLDAELFKNKVVVFAISCIMGFGLVKIFINLVNPPFGWDSLHYHFTFPVEWLKHGNLVNPIVVSCDPSPTYYPFNGSLFFLWLILPLKNVFIADLGQVPFFIIAFITVYSLARKLNLSREYALYSSCIFTLVPNYFKQLEIAYTDIMVAALFLIALYYLFLLNKKMTVQNSVLFSISLGLLIGTKTIALPYAFILYIPFLYFCLRDFKLKKFFILFLLSVFLMIILGGFSYIRNFLETGNPLYPLDLKLFNKEIFKGVIEGTVYRAHTVPKDYSLAKILFSEGLGAQTVIFILPAILLGLPITLIKRKNGLSFSHVYFLILPILLILVYRFIIPLVSLRYLYALLGIGVIIAFYLADILNLPKKLIRILVTLCVFGSIAELANKSDLFISLLFSVALFFMLTCLFKEIKIKKIFKFAFFILIALFLLLIILEKDYVKNEHQRYIKMVKYSGFWPEATKAWFWLNQNTKGNNIAYIGRPIPFPLYGRNFKNNVYYVSVNKTDPAKLHYFKNSKYVWSNDGESMHRTFEENENYRGMPDYQIWLGNLLRRQTDYLFIYSLHHLKIIRFPVEDVWANNHPEIFNLVFKNGTIHIYEIIK